jgi:hypothetical protein
LVNFYVRLAKHYKEFLGNSSEGSFTHCTTTEACELLEKISEGILIKVMSQDYNMIMNVLKYSLFESSLRM